MELSEIDIFQNHPFLSLLHINVEILIGVTSNSLWLRETLGVNEKLHFSLRQEPTPKHISNKFSTSNFQQNFTILDAIAVF